MNRTLKQVICRLAFFSAGLLVSCSGDKPMEELQKAWTQVCISKTDGEERKAVDAMRAVIADYRGVFTLYHISSDGKKSNVQDLPSDHQNFENVQIDIRWDDDNQTFVGSNWVPKNPDNIYAFFLE